MSIYTQNYKEHIKAQVNFRLVKRNKILGRFIFFAYSVDIYFCGPN